MSPHTLYLVRIHAACLIVHGSIGECVVTAEDGIFFHHCQICSGKSTNCGDGFLRYSVALVAVSVTLVAESASLVLQDEILLPLFTVAIVELLLCIHVDKHSYRRSRTHLAVVATT